jgi:hypothetical protein
MERPVLTSVRFPLPDSTNVCRNTEISFNFTQAMDEDSIRRGIEIGEEVTGACPAGTTALTGAYVHTCVGQVAGTIHTEPSGRGTRAVFSLTRALKATTRYRIIVHGDSNLLDDVRVGARNARGVLMAGDVSWMFTTNDRICLANDVVIRDTNPDHPFLFQQPRESHLYTGSVVSMQGGVVVPISSVEEYGWTWQPWLSSRAPILTTSAMAVMTADETASQRTSTSTVQAQNRNGSSLIFAGIRIARDTVSIPSTVGQTHENSHIASVAICERPWPYADPRYAGAMLFSDSAPQSGEPSVLTGTIFEGGPYYNVASMYCMDAGQSATSTDDLPPLEIQPELLHPEIGILTIRRLEKRLGRIAIQQHIRLPSRHQIHQPTRHSSVFVFSFCFCFCFFLSVSVSFCFCFLFLFSFPFYFFLSFFLFKYCFQCNETTKKRWTLASL